MVSLGNASKVIAISQDRRKIAWTRINPKLKSLSTEEYDKQETGMFGPEVDKLWRRCLLLNHKGGPPFMKVKYTYENEKSDLYSLFIQRCPCKVRQQEISAQQLYYSKNRFQTKKYYQKLAKLVPDQFNTEKSKQTQ